jgi:signal transduction histidine kinase
VILRDVRGQVLYQWGHHELLEGVEPLAFRSLMPPFDTWSLAAYADAAAGVSLSAALNVGAALLAVVLSVLLLTVFLYREGSREIREATQKVGFVGQVSHELKTPLTNIRLYAELLQKRLGGEEERTAHQLQVITSESQRLSRLIQNVLTFTRGREPEEPVKRAVSVVDRIVDEVLRVFGPALRDSGFEVVLDLDAERPVLLAPDLLEQVLGNLISNVQKYAASGGFMQIVTRQTGNTTHVTVRDRGPGIPAEHRGRVFQPFVRLGGSLTEGASGAGIGLTISRDLARRHGGDLILEETTAGGSVFLLTLNTPDATEGSGS